MVWLLGPQAATFLLYKSASVGTQGSQAEIFFPLLCLIPLSAAPFQSFQIAPCILQILLQNLTSLQLCSSHEQASSEHRGNMKQTTGWPKSHRPGVCTVWEELTSNMKMKAGLLRIFLSISCSQSSPAMRSALSAGWMF